MDEATDNVQVRLTQLPITRIKAIARADKDVKQVSYEATLVMTKCTELFIQFLANEAHGQTLQTKRKTVQHQDLGMFEHKRVKCSV
eukprot:m.49579 g.49579  ORF g.49579 m.49579 type:complete len:86 (+) comp11104_c0_seq4:220-477(+)